MLRRRIAENAGSLPIVIFCPFKPHQATHSNMIATAGANLKSGYLNVLRGEYFCPLGGVAACNWIDDLFRRIWQKKGAVSGFRSRYGTLGWVEGKWLRCHLKEDVAWCLI